MAVVPGGSGPKKDRQHSWFPRANATMKVANAFRWPGPGRRGEVPQSTYKFLAFAAAALCFGLREDHVSTALAQLTSAMQEQSRELRNEMRKLNRDFCTEMRELHKETRSQLGSRFDALGAQIRAVEFSCSALKHSKLPRQ